MLLLLLLAIVVDVGSRPALFKSRAARPTRSRLFLASARSRASGDIPQLSFTQLAFLLRGGIRRPLLQRLDQVRSPFLPLPLPLAATAAGNLPVGPTDMGAAAAAAQVLLLSVFLSVWVIWRARRPPPMQADQAIRSSDRREERERETIKCVASVFIGCLSGWPLFAWLAHLFICCYCCSRMRMI